MQKPSWNSITELINNLHEMFPDAKCELNYSNLYELIIAVVLSSQTTDKRVNMVTPVLFAKYPSYELLAKADKSDVEEILKPLGMYRIKAENIIKLANKLVSMNHLPQNVDELLTLDGVGKKCANVIASEFYKIPAIAVDTHVARTSKRLKLADGSPLEIEKKLESMFPKEYWYYIHIHLVFLGRYVCKAKSPKCTECLIKNCPSRG